MKTWWIAAAAAAAAGAPLHAADPAPAAPAAIEQAFWLCDHAASRRLLDPGEAAQCSEATERLRLTRFQGDFTALLAWWRQHRTDVHAMLDASEQAAARRAAAGPQGGRP